MPWRKSLGADADLHPGVGDPPQIYDLDVASYESLLVGIFQVHKGPNNTIADKGRFPKMSELNLGFTQDGFHWHRPVGTPFIAATRKVGDWQRAYLHATGGVMLVVGDRLFFYYSGMSGDAPNGPDMYAGGSTGVAFLRRDGFASMDAGAVAGELTTRKVKFSCAHCTKENSVPVRGDSKKQRLEWRGAGDLAALAGQEVRLRFHLRHGRLYSFWVTPHREGESRGYVAAGGPGFRGPVDSPSGF